MILAQVQNSNYPELSQDEFYQVKHIFLNGFIQIYTKKFYGGNFKFFKDGKEIGIKEAELWLKIKED